MTNRNAKKEVVEDAINLLDELEISAIYRSEKSKKYEIYFIENGKSVKRDVNTLKQRLIAYFQNQRIYTKIHHTYINDLTKQILLLGEVVI